MNTISQFAWFAIALLLLLVITQVNQRVGGWLLLVTVMGLLVNAQKRGMLQ